MEPIVFQNTYFITVGFCSNAPAGPFNKDALSAISPYITRHINRFGEYTLDLEKWIWEIIYQMPLAN